MASGSGGNCDASLMSAATLVGWVEFVLLGERGMRFYGEITRFSRSLGSAVLYVCMYATIELNEAHYERRKLTCHDPHMC